MSAPVPRRAVPARLPAPRRLTGTRALVEARLAAIEHELAGSGLLVEQIAEEVLSNGHVRVDVHFVQPPAPPARRWWQGRSRKFWAGVGTGTALALGGCAWAVVAIVQAALAAAAAAAPAAFGALLVVAVVVALANSGGGGTWTGSGTWR